MKRASVRSLSYKRLVTEHLDTGLAILGAVAALILVLVINLLFSEMAYRYIEAPILLFLTCIIYLIIRKKLFPLDLLPKLPSKSSAYLILNVLFFALYSYSILSVILRPEPYSRPLGYFISIAFMAAIIAIEISFFRGRWSSAIIMAKIMLLTLSLWWVPQLMFPGLIGIDPYAHEQFTMQIAELGHISPAMGQYEKMPIMHLIVGTTSLVTGLGYKFSAMFSICFFQAVSLIFIFLLGRFIYNSKVGLIAALLLGIADIQIGLAVQVRPITLGVLLIPVILYLIFRANRGHRVSFTCLALLMSVVLILTHSIAALGMALLLVLLWFSSKLYERIYAGEPVGEFVAPVSLGFSMLFIVAMLSWWTYVTGHTAYLGYLISQGFREETAGWVIVATGESSGAKLEVMLCILGFHLLFGLAILGSLYMVSKKFVNEHSFSLVLTGFVFIAVVFPLLLLEYVGTLPNRWYPIMQLAIVIQAAIGVLVVSSRFSSNLRRVAVLSGLILILCFFSITGPVANMDAPIYSKRTTVRYAFTDSELKALGTISAVYDGEIAVDWYYKEVVKGPREDLTPYLVSGDYSSIEGLVLVREEIIRNLSWDPSSGLFMPDHNPRQRLEALNFDHIYESGGVSAFKRG